MPQSLSRILIHLVFSTKNRERVLTPAVRTELHPYLAGTLDNLECPSLQVGGTEDHVHLFFGLSRTRTIADVVEMVKTSSSKWIKTKAAEFAEFHWQSGYGAFSVSQSDAGTRRGIYSQSDAASPEINVFRRSAGGCETVSGRI